MTDLADRHCGHRSGDADRLSEGRARELLRDLSGWTIFDDGKAIGRVFEFEDFHRTIGFVNAVAWIANREDHHPDLEVAYGRCAVRFSTHSVDGLSENDFICAAKIDRLV